MSSVVTVNGEPFDTGIDHFALSNCHIEDMAELAELRRFANLRSASFAGTNLGDAGLAHVVRAALLENLNLQETEVTDRGVACLERLPRLQYLRLKGNPQLTNACVRHLAQLVGLVDLQIHETSIDEAGLRQLAGLTQLRDICVYVWRGNYSFAGLLELSARMPACRILAKGNGEFLNGSFDGTWQG